MAFCLSESVLGGEGIVDKLFELERVGESFFLVSFHFHFVLFICSPRRCQHLFVARNLAGTCLFNFRPRRNSLR